jgi:DNA-binding response OmpR family regulator
MPNTSKIVVLIADDEPSTVAMLSSHLRSKGYSVLEASDGDQAWELAHEHLPHLVILDVMMPGMSGWEVCRKIREAVSLAHTGVVMLTGIGESLNEMTSPLYGADAHVDKPFEFAVLDAKIKETLERRKQGALGRADGGAEDASLSIEEDDLPTLPPPAKRAAKAPTPKPLAKTKAAPLPKSDPKAAKKAPAKAAAPAKKAPEKKAAAKPAPAPAKKAPVKAAVKAPAKKAAAPAKKAPVKAAVKAPAKKAPAPAKKAPAKQAPPPVKKAAAPAKKAPAKKAPAKKAPAPVKKAPAKKAPVPAKKAPAKKAPAKEAPAPAKKAAKKAPAKKAPAPAKKAPAPVKKPKKK